ncbi:Mycobacterium rhizamassiliense ORFan, partial [Mycobacterium rhizamassiliense]
LDIVLGVSMAPASVQMVLVEGENADGALVEEDGFAVTAIDDSDPTALPDQVIAAILGTREGATEAGFELSSVGVTWTDQVQAAVLRDALSAHRLENVMLVSAFLAATALAQSVGGAMGYERTAVLFVEPDAATLAIVETSDGSIVDIYKEAIEAESYDDALAQLTGMVYWLEEQDYPAGGVFVIGSGVDITPIKPALESATSLRVNVAEEPATALARGAALASANAPLFASSTAALAYAQDPGTGTVDPYVVPEYVVNPLAPPDESADELAYSLVSDEDADAPTVVIDTSEGFGPEGTQRRRPILLVGSGLAVVAISAVVALEIALAIGIRTTVALQPSPNQSLIVPTQQAPAAPRVEASAPTPKISLPAPAAVPRPPVLAALPAPAPVAPPLPAAPVPVPVPIAPILPVPVPVHLPVPAPMIRPPVIESPPVLSPPQRVLTEPPPVRMPEPPSPPEGTGTIPHSPPHQVPPSQGWPPNPGEGAGHTPPPGTGVGGSNGGAPGHFPGNGPGGIAGEPGGQPPLGGGHGGGPLGGGPAGGAVGGGHGGGPLGGGPFGGGGPASPPPLGGGHGGGPFGGGPLGGGPIGGGGPFGGGGHAGGGPIGGGLGGFGGGHAGGGLGGFGGGGHAGGGFGGGGGHSGGGFGGGGHH